jgi:hypothetical protein
MRPAPWFTIEKFRMSNMGPVGSRYGAFRIPYEHKHLLHVIVSDGPLWEHVSATLPNRCPNWNEMCFLKDLFWNDEEAVMQLHPPKSQYVNHHPHCLHLWRPLEEVIPLPPLMFV